MKKKYMGSFDIQVKMYGNFLSFLKWEKKNENDCC